MTDVGKAAARILLYALIAVCPAVALAFVPVRHHGLLFTLGRNAALAGFMILVLQVFLAGRFRWIERPFGLDIVIRFHRHMAVLAVALIVLHPLLLAWGGAGSRLLLSLDQPWYIWLGKGALLALLAQAVLSMFGNPDRLTFERWRLAHDVIAPLLIVAIVVHSWKAGGDLDAAWMRGLWIAAAGVSLAAFAYHRLIRPRRLSRDPYRVVSVERIVPKVWDVRLAPPKGRERYPYLPGQFQFLTFHRGRGLPEEEHHWTISTSPLETGTVGSTIKELGDFTSTIGETRPGDTATVHAPFGRFSYLLHPDETDFVFVAGGIGITPLMGMLRHMRDIGSSLDVLLIYANGDRESIAFRDELGAIERAGKPRLRVVHVLSDPEDDWEGERGRIDAEKLERYCQGQFAGRAFYVCGPPPMIEAVDAALRGFGVPEGMIHLEIFSFID